jgi:hypothetical protein
MYDYNDGALLSPRCMITMLMYDHGALLRWDPMHDRDGAYAAMQLPCC